MIYRVYFGGGDRAWIIQRRSPISPPQMREGNEKWETVAAVEAVELHVTCSFPAYQPGPKPNGYVLVTGTLRIENGTAHFD
ncbi:MAG: hypothetical protein ACRDQZ_18955 [Mycobacteriales bacterium]